MLLVSPAAGVVELAVDLDFTSFELSRLLLTVLTVCRLFLIIACCGQDLWNISDLRRVHAYLVTIANVMGWFGYRLGNGNTSLVHISHVDKSLQ